MSKLDDIRKNKLLEELKSRTAPKWNVDSILFDKQLKFVNDTSKYKAAVCSRRSGKSVSCAVDLLHSALTKPRSTLLYITLTRQNAKALVWKEIQRLDKDYNLNLNFNTTDLTITCPNESMIYCAGAVHEDEIEKFRGYSINKVYLDEAQSFKPWIERLINEVLSPATWDTDGQIVLIGTPGPMPSGYFYDITEGKKRSGWSNHKWTIFDNPHIQLKTGKSPKEILDADMALRGLTPTSPTYVREGLGQWVQDTDALVYRYNEKVNHFEELPPFDEMTYVIGIDIGYKDSDAISVVGFHKTKKKAYLVEEHVKSKQDITELTNEIRIFNARYNPIRMVIDAGGLGKKITEEIVRRHGINLEAAEKSRKLEFIELLNDDLRTARFMLKKTSHTVADYYRLEWDLQTKEKRRISDKYHGDACDATLYAWRAGNHYLSKDKEVIDNSTEAAIERFWEMESKKLEKQKSGDWWEGEE